MKKAMPLQQPTVLAIDIGGTHVKVRCNTSDEVRKVDSGIEMTDAKMVAAVQEMTKDWKYDVVSMGYPGPVLHGRIACEPRNLGPGWVKFDFAKAFGKPTKIINDAAMQALGDYDSGRMLFLGFGTGLGAALVVDGIVEPLELGHMPYKKGRTFEDYVGVAGLERLGKKRWRKRVLKVVEELSAALEPEYVVLGGGNAVLLKEIPVNCRLGANTNAFLGGFRMWLDSKVTLGG
jgi:polyphosphate glucokinase